MLSEFIFYCTLLMSFLFLQKGSTFHLIRAKRISFTYKLFNWFFILPYCFPLVLSIVLCIVVLYYHSLFFAAVFHYAFISTSQFSFKTDLLFMFSFLLFYQIYLVYL